MARQKGKAGNNSLELLEVEYKSLVPTAERFCAEVSDQINTLLDQGQIALALPIESRVKKWDSVLDKLERLSMRIDSVKELKDLVGLRIILLFKRDLEKVCELLSTTFSIIEKYDTQERLKEDQFGYSSVHFIVELPGTWLAVPSMSQLGDFRAEIQVRTMAQHIWAAASHALQYKQEASVPPPVRRSIYRVSALLETIDLEFERVLEQREKYRSRIELPDSEEILNVDLLETVLDTLLPPDNKSENEDYSDLLEDLRHFNIDTVSKLKALLKEHLEAALEDDRRRVADLIDRIKKGDTTGYKVTEGTQGRLNRGVFFNHSGLTRGALETKVGTEAMRNQIIERFRSRIPAPDAT